MVECRGYEAVHLDIVGNIGNDSACILTQLLSDAEHGLFQVDAHDFGAVSDEPARHRFSDTLRSASDNRYASLKRCHADLALICDKSG